MLKIEKFLFYLFIFLLPFQIGKFIYAVSPLPESFYHQFFIYLSDIFIIAFLFFWARRIFKGDNIKKYLKEILKENKLIVGFFVVSTLSIFVASNKALAGFHLMKLLEFLSFYLYIKYNFKYFDSKKFSYVLIFSAILQVIIAGMQFYFQESIGLRYIGESILASDILGVAKISENGFKIIRAYGTFPHPNVLAVFLSLALFMSYYLIGQNKAEIRHELDIMQHNKAIIRHKLDHPSLKLWWASIMWQIIYRLIGQPLYSMYLLARNNFIYTVVFFVISLGLFLSFSRSTIFSTIAVGFLLLAFLVFYKKNNIEIKSVYKLAFLLLIIFSVLTIIFSGEMVSRFSETESTSQRIFYADIAKSAIIQSPIFGVGIGNFIDYFHSKSSNLQEWQYQPAHNLFLLIFAEIGIFGMLLFIIFIIQSLYRAFKNSENLFQDIILFAFLNFLILANIDHYFWTLQQGQILFWLVLGILNLYRKQ